LYDVACPTQVVSRSLLHTKAVNWALDLLDWTEAAWGDRADAATLAVHTISTLQGTMILAVTLKRPELMDEAAEHLKQLAAV
jgi:hypothetical protein